MKTITPAQLTSYLASNCDVVKVNRKVVSVNSLPTKAYPSFLFTDDSVEIEIDVEDIVKISVHDDKFAVETSKGCYNIIPLIRPEGLGGKF